MSREFPQLDVLRVEVRPEVRERHLAAIATAVADAKPRRPRYRLLAVAIAVVFLLPVIALAADNAQPGDLLYPIREAMGWVEQDRSDSSVDLEVPRLADRTDPTVPPDRASSVPNVVPTTRATEPEGTVPTRSPDERERDRSGEKDREEDSTRDGHHDRPPNDTKPPRRGDRP